MSIGFRKSLFGFNSDDVIEYIEKTHKDFVEKETVLKEQLDDLNNELSSAKQQIGEILAEKSNIEAELKKFTDKYDEIERLSQNIGKLYLVAETNANSVIESAKENKEITDNQIAKNIECADNAYLSLAKLNEEINKTTAEFSARVNTLMLSLQKAKNDICVNNSMADKKLEEYKELFDNIKT